MALFRLITGVSAKGRAILVSECFSVAVSISTASDSGTATSTFSACSDTSLLDFCVLTFCCATSTVLAGGFLLLLLGEGFWGIGFSGLADIDWGLPSPRLCSRERRFDRRGAALSFGVGVEKDSLLPLFLGADLRASRSTCCGAAVSGWWDVGCCTTGGSNLFFLTRVNRKPASSSS